jgi:hypothetical protein
VKHLIQIFVLAGSVTAILIGCASPEHRTRYTDKNMRLMIDPASVSPENYARIQTALVQQEMWVVLDRSAGLEAIKKEQETLHRTSSDRYDDKQKWAHWGKLYGVGAIVVSHAQCFNKKTWYDPKGEYYCSQFLNLVDANTGEVILGVEGGEYTDGPDASPDWKKIAGKLADAYPKDFKRQPTSERIENYKSESEEASRRQKEIMIQEQGR